MESMERIIERIIRIKRGEDRRCSMVDHRKRLKLFRVKHISPHKEGYQIRILFNGKIHSAWKAFRYFESESDCLAATVRQRNEILAKLKKSLSVGPVPMGTEAFITGSAPITNEEKPCTIKTDAKS